MSQPDVYKKIRNLKRKNYTNHMNIFYSYYSNVGLRKKIFYLSKTKK